MVTVKELKAEAKERCLRGYLRLTQDELIRLLRTPERNEDLIDFQSEPTQFPSTPIDSQAALFEEATPRIDVPILRPETVKARPQNVEKVVEDSITTVNDWLDWLKSEPEIRRRVSPELESFRQKIMDLYKEEFEIRRERSALKDFTTVDIIEAKDGYDPLSFLMAVRPTVINFLKNNRRIKVKMIFTCVMQMKDKIEPASFHSQIEINLEGTTLDELYKNMMERILENIAAFQRRGSQWVFVAIEELEIHSIRYEPLRGSSYIPLPEWIKLKEAIVNMKNSDQECFKWCIARALKPVKRNAERISKDLRKQSEVLNFQGIEFPVPLKDIDKFKKQNRGLAINVFGVEGEEVYPLRLSKIKFKPINLLLISDSETTHSCLIKNMSRLLSSQISKKEHKKHFCFRCMNLFSSKESLKK